MSPCTLVRGLNRPRHLSCSLPPPVTPQGGRGDQAAVGDERDAAAVLHAGRRHRRAGALQQGAGHDRGAEREGAQGARDALLLQEGVRAGRRALVQIAGAQLFPGTKFRIDSNFLVMHLVNVFSLSFTETFPNTGMVKKVGHRLRELASNNGSFKNQT